jgi:predicted nuclease with TOPRIM domain
MDGALTRAEHNEFAKRMEDEHNRQNKRISDLENAVDQNSKLIVSIEKIATNVENLQKQYVSLSDDVESIKNRDGDNWRKMLWFVGTTVVGIIIGFLLKQFGF